MNDKAVVFKEFQQVIAGIKEVLDEMAAAKDDRAPIGGEIPNALLKAGIRTLCMYCTSATAMPTEEQVRYIQGIIEHSLEQMYNEGQLVPTFRDKTQH